MLHHPSHDRLVQREAMHAHHGALSMVSDPLYHTVSIIARQVVMLSPLVTGTMLELSAQRATTVVPMLPSVSLLRLVTVSQHMQHQNVIHIR